MLTVRNGAFLSGAILAAWALLAFAGCVGNYYPPQDRAPHDYQTACIICLFARGPIIRAWHYVARHPDIDFFAVTAAATVAVARYTHLLKLATDNLWDAHKTDIAASELNAKRELRAYVGVSYAKIRVDRGSLEEFNKLVAIVDYQNAGQTPAHDVDLRMSAKIYGFNVTPPWEQPHTIEDEGKGGVVLPSVTWRRHREVDGSADTDFDALIRALTNGRKRVWIWGTITYRDIFNEECSVEFRFWSSDVKRRKKSGVEYFAAIADIAHTKATYGKGS